MARLATIAVVALALAGTAAAAPSAPARSTCTTHGLSEGGANGRVTKIVATGVGCAKARSVAAQIAKDLATGKPIAVAGSKSMSLSEVSDCTPKCSSSTQIALTYAHGAVTVTIGGSSSSKVTPVPTPSPTPASPGGSSGTIV